jgi:hypothetical protein
MLFTGLFQPRILACLQKSEKKIGPAQRLRLKFIITPVEIATLPWELLMDHEGYPLATRLPIVRYLPRPEPPLPLDVQPPLRLLLTIASPKGVPELDVVRERERIEQAITPLRERKLLQLTTIDHTTVAALQRELRRGVHIWHHIGHGAFDVRAANGSLALETEDGHLDALDAKRLGILLEDSGIRLAVLNACETARFSMDPLLGIAPALVRAGVPAVIAMQFSLPDPSAVEFAGTFYEALADDYPVDACLSEARRAIIAKVGLGEVDWAIPVLYMRSPDGHLFRRHTGMAIPPTLAHLAGPLADTSALPYLDTDALERLLAEYRRMLAVLEVEAAAQSSRAVPLDLHNAIYHQRRFIQAIEGELRRRAALDTIPSLPSASRDSPPPL